MSSPDHHRGISRLDQESVGTHGWQVRLQRKGVRYGRFFSDSAWGGKEKALLKALRFRDRILASGRRRELESESSRRSHKGPAARNRSGVVGVCEIVQRGTNGMIYRFWQANWTTADGIRKSVRFSVLEHGEDRAFTLACRARREAMG
ncbi:MAG: AP2 domain-containing protein [Verrucomicrobiales bacterium]|nr:AP2 domain-containing protein [Verrucomicrobiales bacterium]